MGTKKRLCIPIFNRATYARCKTLILALSEKENIELTIAVSSAALMEEFGNAFSYISDDSEERKVKTCLIPIKYEKQTSLGMVKAVSEVCRQFGSFFHDLSFDGVICVADRFETLGAAIAASYQNIPIIHIQGGEITGNIDEKVRHAVSMLSDYHFPSTRMAGAYLTRMGQGLGGNKGRVIPLGCPSLDLIKIEAIRRSLTKERYIICFMHPETDKIDEAREQTRLLIEAVLWYCRTYRSVCYWQWPNPDAGREEITAILSLAQKENEAILRKEVNIRPEAFLRRLSHARFIIGNSSCGIRECSFLGIPAVNIGARQSLRERGPNVIDAPWEYDEIKGAMVWAHNTKKTKRSFIYGHGNSGAEIAQRISAMEDLSLKYPLQFPELMEFKDEHNKERQHGSRR